MDNEQIVWRACQIAEDMDMVVQLTRLGVIGSLGAALTPVA